MSVKMESPAGEAGQELNDQPDKYNLALSKAKENFLDLFPPGRRSRVTNGFCYAVRGGCSDPYSIVARVLRESKRARIHDLSEAIQAHYEMALGFAEYILQWERLPSEVKRKTKEERASVYREAYLKTQPPTDKQVQYLRALGYKEEVSNRWQASRLIDKLVKK